MAITRWRPFQELRSWEPFGDIDTLRKEMDSLFEQFLPLKTREINGLAFIPSAELDETDAEFHLKLELPGMNAEDLEIEVTDEAVSIIGERKSEKESENGDTLRSEFYYGKFERFIPLPQQIQRDNVIAGYQDGILSLTLPKAQEQKEKATKVKVA
ncbi:MAG: Hsp20/alpha crystallin family protein [Leptolyngbya sp. SIO1D8]|nr:Hsp20/alpha crystallin family protein [Leptolyngbya sp. SIO1D8]